MELEREKSARPKKCLRIYLARNGNRHLCHPTNRMQYMLESHTNFALLRKWMEFIVALSNNKNDTRDCDITTLAVPASHTNGSGNKNGNGTTFFYK